MATSQLVHAQTNLLVNGNFESGPAVNSGGIWPINPGETSLSGWVVTRGQIDYISSIAWTPASGSFSLDLAGSPGSGGIRQSIPTVPNAVYVVQFSIAANPSPSSSPAVLKRLRVRADASLSQEFVFDRTGRSSVNMGWRREHWVFEASSFATELEFFNTTPGDVYGGPALDDASVTPCMAILVQPRSTSACLNGEGNMSVAVAGADSLAYQWQYESAPNAWANAADGPIPYSSGTIIASNVTTDQLQLALNTTHSAPPIRFRCIVTNSCGSTISDPATLQPCQADFTCDGLVEDADFVVFAAAYNILDCADPAMTANCPADLNNDGLVDDSDFVLFVEAYNRLGCL